MKLRFEVDQAEAFRKGVDVPKSIVTIDVDPSTLDQETRNLIADRLMGIDVCQLWNSGDGTVKAVTAEHMPVRVMAKLDTWDALLEAVKADQDLVEERLARHRAVALTIAQSGTDTVSMAEAAMKARKETGHRSGILNAAAKKN